MSELFGSGLAREIFAALMPELCALCRRPVENPRDCPFCVDCLLKWESAKREAANEVLGGVPVFTFSESEFGKALYLAFYEPGEQNRAPNALVYKLKHRATRSLMRFVAEEYTGLLKRGVPELFDGTFKPDDVIVTWMPRRPESVLGYGYDHMELAAKALAERCGFRCEKLLLRRKGSAEQKSLSSEQRLENIGKSLAAADIDMSGRTVILIDDLVTTGSSMRVSEELLMKAGARVVICAALLVTRQSI